MMAALRLILAPALAAGFRLAGLEVDEANTADEASRLVDRYASGAGTGVILLQQEWFDGLPEGQRRALDRVPLPVIVPVPGAQWIEGRGAAESWILDLLQRAIGYRVRLQ
jgi:vacuolar-type H+-ATPase subunit F/Vma7